MARKKAEVAVTCNITQPKQAQKILITALEALQKKYDALVRSGKQNETEAQNLKTTMESLASAVTTNEQNMERVKKVMDNLSGSTLRQLNAALREVKKQMQGKSSDSKELDSLKAKYNAITEQIKVLKGETVNVKKGIQDISEQSDAWLTKAIAKQKELLSQTKRNTDAYDQQKRILAMLESEQVKRQNVELLAKGSKAMGILNKPGASLSALRTARQDLVNYRDSIGNGGNSFGSTEKDENIIRQINKLLKDIDAQIDSINGKEKKVAMSAQTIVESVKQIDFSKATPNELKAKLDEVNRALSNMGRNDPMRKQLVRSANQLNSALARVNGSAVDVSKVLKNLKSAPLEDLRKAASQLEKEISQLNRKSDAQKLAKKKEQLRQLNQEIERGNKALTKQKNGWKDTFQAITAYMGVTMIIGRITSMMSKLLNLNLKFSDQLADIRKVSGLAMKDIDNLATRLASIDTRTSIEELNSIAYAGAKLGIGKYGVDGLEGFVRAANQVNVALKEDLGSDALTALSKITEVMGLISKMGVEESMLRTGSAMFQLSATSTATAGNIVEFSKRLTGLAKVTGVTTDQLLGLASASDAMYLMPEVSATAFNKLFTSLQTKHNLIEKELSITPGTINNLYSAGKAMDAMILIFEKMKEKGNMNALQGVFKDLGSDGARLVNVMVTMSQNVDMLKSHLEVSKQAFEEGTAVTNEYNIQQETAQALMERASNAWEKAFVNPKGVDSVKELAQAWYNLSVQLTSNPFWMGGAKLVLGSIITAVETLLALLPALLTGLLFKGVVGGIMSIHAAITTMNGGVTMSTLATNGLAAAWRTLNAVQKVNIFAALITAVMALVTLFSALSRKMQEATSWMKGFDSSVHGVYASIAIARDELTRYVNAINEAERGTNRRTAAINNFNKKFGKYHKVLLTEKSTATDIAKAYERVNRALERKAILELKEKDLQEHYNPAVGWTASRLSEYGDLSGKSGKLSQYDSSWLKGYFDDAKDLTSALTGLAKTFGVNQKYVNEALKHRSDASIVTSIENPVVQSNNPRAPFLMSGGSTALTIEEQMLFAAARYGSQYFSTKNRKRAIDEKYKPWEDLLSEDPVVEPDTPLGDLSNLAPDKDAETAAKRAKAERKRELLQDLKEAEDEASAIIDNIKNFYQRQINQILKFANEQGWDEALIQSTTDVVKSRMNVALSQARKGIAGAKNEWESFTSTMEADMLEIDQVIGVDNEGNEITYNESRVLLGLILNNDLDALHDKIVGIEKALNKPSNAALDAIWKNATGNEGANETATQRHLRERRKLLLEDAYTEKVDSDYTSSMTKLGFFDVDEAQAQKLLAGGPNAQALLQKRSDEIKALFSNVRENIVELLNIDDVTTDEGRNRLLEIIFGPDWEKGESELKEVFLLAGEDLRLFYEELIKYDNDYLEARKRAEERAKKLADFQWDHSSKKATLDAAEANNSLYGKGLLQHMRPDEASKRSDFGVYGNTSFVSDFGVDPEIESYRLKIEAAKAYYDFLRAHGMEEDQLREQQKAVAEAQAAYVEKLTSRIKKQMDEVLGMHEPIENFGTKAGEAFALMTEDAEAGRKALKAAVGDMINDFMKQTVEMTKEYIKRRIMQKVHDRLTSVEASAHEAELTEIQTAGDATRLTLHETIQTGLTTIDQTQAAVRETTNVEEHATELGVDAAAGTAEVAVGTASGAAKTIGSLGWWGIPLVAVISALLGALLSFAMSKVSKFFGGGTAAADTGPQTKLVSGMLTYDSGNVQAFRGVEDGKTYPVVGSDGKVYAAKDGGELSTGLVEDPITTLVNGQPALVAERGPEMVIGRETTAAMMMARPDILAEIVKFDRQRSGRTYRAYDSGNIDSLHFSVPDGSAAGSEDMAQLRETINALTMVLSALQRDGIPAHINKYGRGGVTESARSGGKFMQRNSGDPLWRG